MLVAAQRSIHPDCSKSGPPLRSYIPARIEVIAIIRLFRVGEVGHLAIEATATGDVKVIRAPGHKVDDRIERQRPDMRITGPWLPFPQLQHRQLVVDVLVIQHDGYVVG